MKLVIKNMVCLHCINAVKTILLSKGYTIKSIMLADIEIMENLSPQQKESLNAELKKMGFELLDDPRTQLVEQIRISIQQWARINGDRPNISEYLSSHLCKDYSMLSKLFSEVRGITIERFSTLHRIEYAKELLCYNELSISQIAYLTGYSSPAHFSNTFKDVTGMSPKLFRNQNQHDRKPLNEL